MYKARPPDPLCSSRQGRTRSRPTAGRRGAFNTKAMKRLFSTLTAMLAALVASASLHADANGPWQFRIRSTSLEMTNKSDALTALSINLPSEAVSVNSKWIPEFDVSNSFTNNLVTELDPWLLSLGIAYCY